MSARLQTELRQSKPFTSKAHEAYLALQRTADLLDRGVAEALRPHGLTPTQYNALRILRGAPAEGLTTRDVGDRLVTRDPDVTRLLDRLEAQGWAVRARATSDRRVVHTRLTPAGRTLIDALDAPIAALHRSQLGHLGRERLTQLVDWLDEVRASEMD